MKESWYSGSTVTSDTLVSGFLSLSSLALTTSSVASLTALAISAKNKDLVLKVRIIDSTPFSLINPRITVSR